MYVETSGYPVRRGASRRKKKLRRTLKKVRIGVGAMLLVALMLACGWLGAGFLGNVYTYSGTTLLQDVLPTMGGLATNRTGAKEEAPAAGEGVHLAVTPTLQTPQLQNGCEATSLAMVLQYLGYQVEKTDIAYGFIPSESFAETGGVRYGPHPGDAYPGDAGTSQGFYCYAGPVAEGGNSFLALQGGSGTFQDATGESLESLQNSLAAGYPVIIWATLQYTSQLEYMDFTWQLPDGRTYTPYRNLHCVVLTGYDSGSYTVCDPLQGSLELDAYTLQESYEAMGNRAVVYQP